MTSIIQPIRPICPIIRKELPILQNVGWKVLINMSVIFLISMLIAFCISRYSVRRFKGEKTKTTLFFMCISGLAAIALLCVFGCTATAIKGIVFTLVLLFCSYSDIKTRECDDYPHLMIMIAACIGTELTALPGMLLSALAIFGIMLLTCLMKATVNGADLKLATACTFFLGFEKGVAGLLVGLILAVAVNLIKKNKKGFPLIPYLAIGYMMAFFI